MLSQMWENIEEKIIIVSNYCETLDIIQSLCNKRGYPCIRFDGKTNIGVIANYYQRDRVNSQDDPRWSNADLTDRLPTDSPWYGHSEFDSTSANSLYGQFDFVDRVAASNPLRTEGYVDGSGEFETYPIGDERCV